MSCSTSDHIQVWIVPSGIDPPPLSKAFRFEEVWLTDEGCGRIIESAWRTPCHSQTGTMVMKKIEKCGSELTQWSRKTFGNIRRELREKRKLLSKAEKVAMQTGANFRLRELKKEINQLMVKENILWRQRAKSFWLVGGDQNSKYFHSRATLRHRRNIIKGVQNLAGEWLTHPSEIAYSFTDFY